MREYRNSIPNIYPVSNELSINQNIEEKENYGEEDPLKLNANTSGEQSEDTMHFRDLNKIPSLLVIPSSFDSNKLNNNDKVIKI